MHTDFANSWNASKYPKELSQTFLIMGQWLDTSGNFTVGEKKLK